MGISAMDFERVMGIVRAYEGALIRILRFRRKNMRSGIRMYGRSWMRKKLIWDFSSGTERCRGWYLSDWI